MKTTRSIRILSIFVATAAVQLSTPGSAKAASALFRTNFDPTIIDLAQVGTTTPRPRVTLPAKAISRVYTYSCGFPPFGPCNPTYAVSRSYYSLWNSPAAQLVPNNPHAPTATTTFTGPTSTTAFSNDYGFSRDLGRIRVTPGSKRFGGTIRFMSGPDNNRYYKVANNNLYSYASTVTAVWNPAEPTGNIDQTLGYSYLGWIGVRRDLTLTTGPPSYGPVTRKVKTFYTTGPWTTGMVEVHHTGATRFIDATETGYDNRTANGLNGVLSLVRPRLVNNYVVLPSGSVVSIRSEAQAGNLIVEFLPESGALLSLAVGTTLLTGLYRIKRR